MGAVLRVILLAAGLSAAVGAHAHFGWTMQDANVRAGPAREFPLVGWLPLGSVVRIHSCVHGWTWCDVEAAAEGMRGFIYSGYLAYPYGDAYVVVRDAGPYLGIPVMGFVLEPYWSQWYWNRSWYPAWRDWRDWSEVRPGRPGASRPPPAMRPTPSPGIAPRLDLSVPRFTQPVPRFEPAPPPGRDAPDGTKAEPRAGDRP